MKQSIKIERLPEGIRITPQDQKYGDTSEEFYAWLRNWRDRRTSRPSRLAYAVGYIAGSLKS